MESAAGFLKHERHAQMKSKVWEFSITQWSIHYDFNSVKVGDIFTSKTRPHRDGYNDQKNIQPCISGQRAWDYTNGVEDSRYTHEPKTMTFHPCQNLVGPLGLLCTVCALFSSHADTWGGQFQYKGELRLGVLIWQCRAASANIRLEEEALARSEACKLSDSGWWILFSARSWLVVALLVSKSIVLDWEKSQQS